MLPADGAELIRARGALPVAALSGEFQARIRLSGTMWASLTARLCRTQNPVILVGAGEISPFEPVPGLRRLAL
jgi:hypothetical protein